MKKMTIASALLAIMLVAGSAFKNSGDPVPTQGRTETGLIDLRDDYECNPDSGPCLYDENDVPIPGSFGIYEPKN